MRLRDIQKWNVDDIISALNALSEHSNDSLRVILGSTVYLKEWGGETARASKDAIGKTVANLDQYSDVIKKITKAFQDANEKINDIKNNIRGLSNNITAHGMSLDLDGNTMSFMQYSCWWGWV